MERLIRAAALGLGLGLAGLLVGLELVQLETVPPLSWDEGWTLSVARNWVERGHYGLLLEDRPRAPGLAAAFPVVAPVALAFRLLGVGIGPGRLAGVVLTLATFALAWWLAARLYDRRVAWATLAVMALLVSPSPLFQGRRVLGEMPAMFYLVAGHAALLAALRGSGWWTGPAAVLWGLAIGAKAQVLPFWAASVALPLGVACLRRAWPAAWRLALGGAGAWVSWQLLARLVDGWLGVAAYREPPVPGLYELTTLVLGRDARLGALRGIREVGLPAVLGLGAAAWGAWRERGAPDSARQLGRLALLGLAGSWLLWFAALALPWVRYLFPPLFLASPLVASALRDLTGGLDPARLVRETVAEIRAGRRLRPAGRLLGWAVALALAIPLAAGTVSGLYFWHVTNAPAGRHVLRAAAFLNARVPPGALIELYDAELVFLLNRRYHYPPDQVHVALNRRFFLREAAALAYDPLVSDPDYLVTGPLTASWRLYDAALASGAFRPLAEFGAYGIYERVRPAGTPR